MDVPLLLWKTLLLRPYVFFFLGVALVAAARFLGWKRTCALFGITWLTAFVCEYSSTRIGFPFGDYYYTGSTVGEELYLANIPFMDSLSFTFLLYASYCLALWLVLPVQPASPESGRRLLTRESLSWPVIGLTCLLFMLIDVVIDPVALRGDRWFLGQIYGYPDPGVYFGVPLGQLCRMVRCGPDCDDGIPVAGPAARVVVRASPRDPGQGSAARMRVLLRGPAVQCVHDLLDRRMVPGTGRVPALHSRDRPGAPETSPLVPHPNPLPEGEGVNALVLPSFVILDACPRRLSPT